MGESKPASLGSLCGEKELGPSRESSTESLSKERRPTFWLVLQKLKLGSLIITAELLVCKWLQHLQAPGRLPSVFPGREGEHLTLVGPFHRSGLWRLSPWGPGSWPLVHSGVCPSGSFRASGGLKGHTAGQLTSTMSNRDLDGLQEFSRHIRSMGS